MLLTFLSFFLTFNRLTQILRPRVSECLGKQSLQDEEELETFKQDLFHYGILNYCAMALRLNFTKSYGGYKTAVQIADILR